MALFADSTFGQSLSIVRKGGSELWLEASMPPDSHYTLQASANLHLWVDINDEVQNPLSYRFDSIGVTNRFFRLTPWTPPAPPIRLVMIGDSTVADFTSNQGFFNGWGQGIYGYFKPTVTAVNLAMPMYSTEVFLHQTEMTTMLKIKPNYVLIQFGWFDGVLNSPGVSTTLQQYADNLKTIVQTIRGFNGIPILITPPVQRFFDANGKVYPIVPDRCTVVREVAAELQVHLIDLQQLMMDLLNEMGDTQSAYIWSSDTEKGHYSTIGAQVIAQLVVNALPDSLGTYLTGILDPRPTP